MPSNSRYARYKQHIKNCLFYKYGWDRDIAIIWLNANEKFVRDMMATDTSYQITSKVIDDMEKKINAES